MSSLQAESRIPTVPLFISLAFQPAKWLDFPMLDPQAGVLNRWLKLLNSQGWSPLLSSVESPPWGTGDGFSLLPTQFYVCVFTILFL